MKSKYEKDDYDLPNCIFEKSIRRPAKWIKKLLMAFFVTSRFTRFITSIYLHVPCEGGYQFAFDISRSFQGQTKSFMG